jgi:peptidoglycan-N-acetylmuramic acid deacetylase
MKFALIATAFLIASNSIDARTNACSDPKKAVYLTFDTGHMAVAPLVADVLSKHQVKVTFFVADEATKSNGSSLDNEWAPWWRARLAEGHEFASHTWDHDVWQRDTAAGFVFKPTAGPNKFKTRELDAAQYCTELQKPLNRLKEMDNAFKPLPLFRAPGGKTSPKLLAAAQSCGFKHVGWTAAGFLGDELPSDKFPNSTLLKKALRDVKAGDIMLAHLGIWSRADPWAPAVLEPLIVGLKAKGLCFAQISQHPSFKQTP